MAEAKRGPKLKPEKEKKVALQYYVKKKNLSKIKKQVTPIVKELDQ